MLSCDVLSCIHCPLTLVTSLVQGQPIDHESQQRVELLIQEVCHNNNTSQPLFLRLTLSLFFLKLSEVRLKLRETESQSEMLSQQLHTTQQKLESRDTEITLLSREREYWPVSYNPLSLSLS